MDEEERNTKFGRAVSGFTGPRDGVRVKRLNNGHVLVREPKDTTGGQLWRLKHEEWMRWVRDVKAGVYDGI